jgi:methyl acetate hydrolase
MYCPQPKMEHLAPAHAPAISRRTFSAMALLLAGRPRALSGATRIKETLEQSLRQKKIPAATAMVANAKKTLYTGAFGVNVNPNSVYYIASMTKAITSTAAMQLVEQGKVHLDEPVAKHLPQLANLDVLQGFDQNTGKPILGPAGKPVTLRLLLSHTSGFCYDTWDEQMFRYVSKTRSCRRARL